MTGPTPFFTNLVDSEDTAGEVIGAGSSEGTEDDVHLLFRHITDMKKVCVIWMNSFILVCFWRHIVSLEQSSISFFFFLIL